MRKYIGALIAALTIAAGLTLVTPAAAQAAPGSGCVTLGEARNTFAQRTQTLGAIERGLGAHGYRGKWSTKNTLVMFYKPCVRPGSDWAWADVVYTKRAGRWQTAYWFYSLFPGHGRAVADSWAHDTMR